ncbi:unnamed protein product [Larinioides sclopetarius]|uniref:Thioredoxin domain-containing protein n=1 Tax=Larinioides sclopetarius TaxID=280406 RepID=A0AAV1YW00_9ARAC
MEVLSISGVDELSEKLNSLSERFIVLFFHVEDSAECNLMNQVITELQNDDKNKNAAVIKINASKDVEICKKYKVTVIPTFVFINSKLLGSNVVDNLVGANGPLFSKQFEEQVGKLKEFCEIFQCQYRAWKHKTIHSCLTPDEGAPMFDNLADSYPGIARSLYIL